MRKHRTRILAGGAVAVFAAATAFAITSTAGATTSAKTIALTTTTAKTGTTLSIMAALSRRSSRARRTTISGTLLASGNPAGNREIELYRYNQRLQKWRLIRIKLTSKAGAVTFTVQPDISREYKLVYHGSSTLAPVDKQRRDDHRFAACPEAGDRAVHQRGTGQRRRRPPGQDHRRAHHRQQAAGGTGSSPCTAMTPPARSGSGSRPS